jgi:molecular chaperone HscB
MIPVESDSAESAAIQASTNGASVEAMKAEFGVLLDPRMDHFARLGLPATYALSRDALEERYLRFAAMIHPDHHQHLDDAEKRRMMIASGLLNESYRVLRSPIKRAEYLVRLGGIDLDSTDPIHGAPLPSQAFLMEMIERRETMEERADSIDEVIEEVEDACDAALARAVAHLDRGEVREAATSLVERRYYERLREEIAGETCTQRA